MQASLLRHRELFLWPPMGHAYNLTLYQLCLRARSGARRAENRVGQRVRKEAGRPDCHALLPAAVLPLVDLRRNAVVGARRGAVRRAGLGRDGVARRGFGHE